MKLHLNKALKLAVLACMACTSAALADTAPSSLYTKPAITDANSVSWTGQGSTNNMMGPLNWEGGVAPTDKQYRVFDNGGNITLPSALNGETVKSGIVVSNNTTATMTVSRWVGDLIVDNGSTLNLTFGNTGDSGVPHAYLQETGSGTTTVYVDGTLNLADPGICMTGWNASSYDQVWVVGQNGKITFSGDYYLHRQKANNPKDWYIQAVVDVLDDTLLNRDKTTTSKVILDTSAVTNRDNLSIQGGNAAFPGVNNGENVTTATLQNVLDFIVVQGYDTNGKALGSDAFTVAKDASTGITVTYATGYSAMDLTWGGDSGAVWGDRNSGFVKAGDATHADTSFMNGDSVTFGATPDASTVSVAEAGVSVKNMTVAGDYKFTDGGVSVAGTLTVQDGGKADISSLSMGGDSSIAIKNGELALNNNLDDTKQKVTITMGNGDEKGTLKLASGVELKYDGVTYRGTADGSEISSTNAKAVSVWHDEVTLKNVEIDFSEERNIGSKLDGATINVQNGATVRFQKEQTNVKSVNVEAGGYLNADGYSATVTGDSLIEGDAVASITGGKNGKFVLQGTTTVTGEGNLHSSTNSVVIKAAAPKLAKAAGEDEGSVETAPSSVLKNVTVSNSGLSSATPGTQGSVTGGYVALSKDGTSVSNIDFEDVTLSISDAITMQDVKFGTGTQLVGDGSISMAGGTNTVVLDASAIAEDGSNVTLTDDGVTVTYNGLGAMDFGSSTFALELTHDFIVALQKEVLPEQTDVLTIDFGTGVKLTNAVLEAGNVSASYLAVDGITAGVKDDGGVYHGVTVTFQKADAIPEPATAALSLLALAGLAARRRRKH